MAEDLWYGGLEPELDCGMIAGRPDDPELRESASVWVFEENGEFAFLRMGIEAQGAVWENHRYDCNFALGGGRILRQSTRGPTLPVTGSDGRDNVLGAGGLRFECLEPFRRWRVSFEDTVLESTVGEQIGGRFKVFADAPIDPAIKRTPIKVELELEMAAPGWTQDLRPDKVAGMSEAERTDAGLMGFGWRVEQLFRGEGELTVDGRTRSFRAVGNRVHRQSVRPMGAFRGHCWQAALFPDGRGFAFCTYPPREDGTTYNDGYIFQDGRMYKATARNPAFLRNIMPEGDDVAVELESELGITRIEGRTLLSSFHVGNPGVGGMTNQQGTAKYTWDGVSAYGMIERSSPAALCTIV